ncbi:uncharacterized protein LOC130916340 [Corythoichthys intestinalis]|uniref:uncharacterized protein LOC130916340 n=1 Tax=Corythoichthys intestinalis TaxID=161448 RepID=UPI0025A60A34|nr:uncharacterized protein LOC130916340 [Corythoichthys intestinalis]
MANTSKGKTDMDPILREIREFRLENRKQFDVLKEDILKVNVRLDEAENRIERTEERVGNAETAIAEMLKLNTELLNKLLDLDCRSRRENIRIYGVPEGAENDSPSMKQFVEQVLHSGLGLADKELDLNIERAHRSLGPTPPKGVPPRSILVKFKNFLTKETLLRRAWQGKGFVWNKNHINVDHDYPPMILKKRKEYAEVRKVLKEDRIPFQTLFPARLRVRFKEETKIYDTIEEATDDMAKRGYNITTIRPPGTTLEQIQRLQWTKAERLTTRDNINTGRATSYKERLRAFRRTPSPSSEK